MLPAGCVSSLQGERGVGQSPIGAFPTGRFVQVPSPLWAFESDEDGTWRGYDGNVTVECISGKFAVNGDLCTAMTHDYGGSA